VLLPLVSNPSLSFSYDTLPFRYTTYTRRPPVPTSTYLPASRYIPTKCRADNKIKSCHVPVADEARFPILVPYPPRGGSPAQIWLASVHFFGFPFFGGALAARAQGGILFRFVKGPSLMPVPQLPRGHATRLEAVKGRQTKNQTCEWTDETQPQTKSKKSSYFIFPYPFAHKGPFSCL
jgi:hypothetical protein